MRKIIFILTLAISTPSLAKTNLFIDLKGPCEELEAGGLGEGLVAIKVDSVNHVVQERPVDMRSDELKRLCEEFRKNKNEAAALKAIEFDMDQDRKWKLIFTYGPFLAYYQKTNMRLTNEDTDLQISGLQPIQRSGLHHYKFWSGETKPFQFIDEPQNKIGLELTNDDYFFGAEYAHPKILFQDNYSTPDNNQSVSINGVIGNRPVNVSDARLGNYIYQIQASHGNTNINLYAGKVFDLLSKRSNHDLEIHLGGGAGVSFANGVSKYWVQGEPNLKINEDQGLKVYGWNAVSRNRLRYTFPRDRVSVALTYDFTYTRMDGPVGDFNVESSLMAHHFGIGVGVRLDDLFKKKRKQQ